MCTWGFWFRGRFLFILTARSSAREHCRTIPPCSATPTGRPARASWEKNCPTPLGGSLHRWDTEKYVFLLFLKGKHIQPPAPSPSENILEDQMQEILTLTLWYENKSLRGKIRPVSIVLQLSGLSKALGLLPPALGRSLRNAVTIWSVTNGLLSWLSGQGKKSVKFAQKAPNSAEIDFPRQSHKNVIILDQENIPEATDRS